jgi:anti-anti-sigma factor
MHGNDDVRTLSDSGSLQTDLDPAAIPAGRSALDIAISIDEPGTVVSLSGRLAAATVADVRSVLVAALDSGAGDLVVDLHEVELVDASGLGVLVGAHRQALRCERRLVLRNIPSRIERLLAVTHLNRVLTVDDAACA